MRILSGRVVEGRIVVEGCELREGERVTVLAPEAEEAFALSPEDVKALRERISEADRGEFVSETDLMRDLEETDRR